MSCDDQKRRPTETADRTSHSPLNGGAPFVIRTPRAEDGPRVTALIGECPPLDANSAYCNLLQCTHFAETCVVTERHGKLVGWLSGYRLPAAPEQFFVWQVAVHPSARGMGLGGRMLDELINRPAAAGVTTIVTTITEPNAASWSLFGSLARRYGAQIARRPLFERDVHFAGRHDTEHLVSISPVAGIFKSSVEGDI